MGYAEDEAGPDPGGEHVLVIAAEVPLPEVMLVRVLRAGWYDHPGGRIAAIDVYCKTCRQTIERIRVVDRVTGKVTIVPCQPEEWLHGGPIGTRKKRTGNREASSQDGLLSAHGPG